MVDNYQNDNISNVTEVKFRSGFGLQSRELNAIQEHSNNQISPIGDHLFKEGSPVVGGSLKYEEGKTLLVESTYLGNSVDLNSFLGQEFVELDSNGVETGAIGKVIAVSAETDLESAAIHYSDQNIVKIGESIDISTVRVGTTSSIALIKTTENPVRDCSYARLLRGKFYYNKKFITVEDQLKVYSKFDNNFSGYVGLSIETKIVTEFDDPSLYDPSRGSSNYNAPGAHREQLIGTLGSKSYSDDLDANFIILSEFQSGNLKTMVDSPELNVLGDILAVRTSDESGDYVKNVFKSDILENVIIPVDTISPTTNAVLVAQIKTVYPNNYAVGDKFTIPETSSYAGTYTVKEVLSELMFTFDIPLVNNTTETNKTVYRNDYFGLQVSPGVAYVKGYRIEIPSTRQLEIKKAVDTEEFNNNIISTDYSQYVVVNTLTGMFDTETHTQVSLRDSGDGTIGTARVRAVENHSSGEHRLFLFDINMNSGETQSDVHDIYSASGWNGAAHANVVGTFNLVGINNRQMLFPVGEHTVNTLSPLGSDTVSYVSNILYSQAAASNVVVYNTTGTRTFLGSIGTELVGTSSFTDNYVIINGSTGTVIAPTSAVISNNGKTLTMNVGVSVQILTSAATVVKPVTKTKAKTSGVLVTGTSAVSPSSKTVMLTNTDIIDFTVTEGAVDITDRFDLDNGQRDTFYDYGSIILKNGTTVPTGALTINYNYYVHSGSGYFSVDSYPDINNIEEYSVEASGQNVSLRDVVDFRPTITGSGFADNLLPAPGGTLNLDFLFYNERKDLVVLTNNGYLTSVEGIPDLFPQYPHLDDNTMALFKVDIEPLTSDPTVDVSVKIEQNRRYTMKDIGIIDRRVNRLEYETSLSLLESSTKQQDILDASGLTRFKTGFVVDNFVGHALGDTESADYTVSVDRQKNELRPSFNSTAKKFEATNINGLTQSGNDETGYFLTLPYSTTSLVNNNVASKGVSVNPFLVTKRVGVLQLSPSSDFWVDETTAPVRNVDLGGANAAASENNGTGAIWNEWQTDWTGTPFSDDWNPGTRRNQRRTPETNTAITAASNETTVSLGSSLIDVDISPFIRAQTLSFVASGLRPNTDLHVFIDNTSVNNLVTTSQTPTSQGSIRSDIDGRAVGTIAIPAGTYHTGERIITVSDEPNNVTLNATTEAFIPFAAQGLMSTSQELMVTTRAPVIVNVTNVTNNPDPNVGQDSREMRQRRESIDPLAQTFWVSEESYPNGVFATSIDLYFKRKPSSGTDPVRVQIRPTENGYPHSSKVIPIADKIIQIEDVNIPTLTNSMDSVQSTPTTITFDAPIYLSPKSEFSFIVLSDNAEYELYISEMGQKILGTENVIHKQPVLGSSFRSQNSITWTAFQNEDLMMGINIAVFDTENTGTVDMNNELSSVKDQFNIINYQPQYLDFDNTSVDFELSTLDASTLSVVSKKLSVKTNTLLSTEKLIRENSRDVTVSMELKTSDQFVSPFFDLDRQYGIFIKNKVNFYGLIKSGIFITSQGTSYVDPVLTVTGGGGTGAVLNAVLDTGRIVAVEVENGGSGYTSAPTITVSDSIGTGATFTYSGFETDSSSGNSLARYITKPVVLAEGFETDLATIYADMSMPAQTDIQLFVRAVAASDPTPINHMSWKEIPYIVKKPATKDEFYETKFEVDMDYTDANGALQTTAKIIQVKIVLLSLNTSVVPKVKNFRMITSI